MFRFILLSFLFIHLSYGETLDQILDIALKESPFLKTYLYKTKAIDGELQQAKAIKNPEISVEFGRIYSQIENESGFNLTSLEIKQPLRLWNEKKFAIKSAKLKKQAFEYLYDFQKNILISKLYKAFYTALFLKEKINLKQKELENLKSLYEFLKKSYRLGEIVQLDLFRAEKDLNITRLELERLKSDYRAQLGRISAIAGKEIKDISGNFYKLEDDRTVNLEEIPEIQYYKTLLKSIEQDINRQKALSKPQISIGLIAGEDEVDLGKYEFGISISSTVPVFYRRQGEILSLINQKKSILSIIRQKILNYKADIQRINSQINLLKKQYSKLDKETIPAISNALNLAEKSYRLKVITYFEFSDVRKQFYQTLYYKLQILNDIHSLYGEYIKSGGLR